MNDKALLMMRLRISTPRKMVTVLFSASDRLFQQMSIILHYQYPDVQHSGVSYWEDPLNLDTIMLDLRLPLDSRVSSKHPAHKPQNRVSSSITIQIIDLSIKKQQSSFASAEGVVPPKEYPSRRIQ